MVTMGKSKYTISCVGCVFYGLHMVYKERSGFFWTEETKRKHVIVWLRAAFETLRSTFRGNENIIIIVLRVSYRSRLFTGSLTLPHARTHTYAMGPHAPCTHARTP